MIELEKHNFAVPNEITDSNNYQLMKPMDKRLNLTTKDQALATHEYEYTYTKLLFVFSKFIIKTYS